MDALHLQYASLTLMLAAQAPKSTRLCMGQPAPHRLVIRPALPLLGAWVALTRVSPALVLVVLLEGSMATTTTMAIIMAMQVAPQVSNELISLSEAVSNGSCTCSLSTHSA